MELSILSPDGRSRLGADVRSSLAPNDGWQLVVRANVPNTEVTVRWPDLGPAPRSLRFHLVDETTGARRYMRTSSAYTFRTGSTSEERRFRIESNATTGPDRLVSQPLANFIAVTDTNQTIAVANSTTGAFTIPDVPPGSRAITITAQAFVAATSAPRTVTAGATTDFGDINLDRNVPNPPNPPAL